MSEASRKNQTALKQLTGNEALCVELATKRIGVITPELSGVVSAAVLTEALAEMLGRLWNNLDVRGPYSKIFVETAIAAANSGKQTINANDNWSPPYDFLISIGTKIPDRSPGIQVGANGWEVSIGEYGEIGRDPNPVGPFAAACLASAQLFRSLFASALKIDAAVPREYHWSAWYRGTGAPPPHSYSELKFVDTNFFGNGTVTHALMWILQRWPGNVEGEISLIDHDKYDQSNGQRYIGMRDSDVTAYKTKTLSNRLIASKSKLSISTFDKDMNNYFASVRPNCKMNIAVAGLDSIEDRRQLQLKLPHTIVNMWTSQDALGSSRYKFDGNWPCMFCVHPLDTSGKLDEVGEFYEQTRIDDIFLPWRIRELFLLGTPLDEREASAICQKFGLEKSSVLGRPLRTVRALLCATTKISLPNSISEADVPLVFAGGLSGLAGFVELTRELLGFRSDAGFWQSSILRNPTEHDWIERSRLRSCYLCSDPSLPNIMTTKYGS
ncbi:MAG: ThiF family adenylyltransferase [Thaumarchaeota archaeon]|nr:ThiF family adenylyltransferase [Nitrososphaerota archaeon]